MNILSGLLHKLSVAIASVFLLYSGAYATKNDIAMLPKQEFNTSYIEAPDNSLDIYHLEQTVQDFGKKLAQLDTYASKQNARLGSTFAIETPIALFETTLASKITSTATTMTLVSALTKNGTNLASSTYGFVIDEGTSDAEFVSADCTSTTCTNMTRGISVTTGTTTVAALQKPHGRGASVKITTAPLLVYLTRIINGIGTFPNLISYTSGTACTGLSASTAICSKAYVDSVAIAGASDANTTVKGIVEIATRLETASSTVLGSTGATIVVPASAATSTPGLDVITGTTGKTYVVVTRDDGKINPQFVATSTTDAYNYAGPMSYSATSTWTGTGTSTFSGRLTVTATSTFATTTATSVLQNGVAVTNKLSAFSSGTTFGSGSTATSTLMTFTVSAGTLRTGNGIHARIYLNATRFFTGTFRLAANYGGVSAAYKSLTISSDTSSQSGFIDVYLQNTAVAAQQTTVLLSTLNDSIPATSGTHSIFATTGAINSAADQTFSITASFGSSDASNGMTTLAGYAELIQN